MVLLNIPRGKPQNSGESCLYFERFWCISGGLSADQLCKTSIASVTETRFSNRLRESLLSHPVSSSGQRLFQAPVLRALAGPCTWQGHPALDPAVGLRRRQIPTPLRRPRMALGTCIVVESGVTNTPRRTLETVEYSLLR